MPENLSFWEHLDELRSALLKSLCAWLLATVAAFCAKDWLFEFLMRPLMPNQTLINIDVTAQFVIHIQVSLCIGLIVAFPLIIYWLYGFLAPALYVQEKRFTIFGMTGAILLFAAGVALNYFVIFPVSFRFLSNYQVTPMVENQISLSSYISLLLVLSILMGILFEVPILTWTLSKMGLLQREHLQKYRRYVFVGILILAAVITPTGDPITLLLVSIPVYLLYELSILAIR